MTNLLANTGFEADWGEEESHDCLVITAGGEIHERVVDNIFTPPGWTTWFRHIPDTWDQPEVRDAWKENDPNRVHSGEKGILLFTFGRKHDAGFLQVVDVEPGQRLRATVWCHAWSNHIIAGHEDCYDNGRCSCGVGTGPGFWWEDEVPGLNQNQWNDAKQNFRFMLGIDPTGGTDPYSDTVVWGRAAYIYNVYAQLEVEAVAEMHQVTMFLRSTTQFRFKHNDAYYDDAILEVVDAPAPPPYESTMLVLPQDATPDQLREIFTLAYPDRRTFGFSHDDAGNLNGTAILYNIPTEEKPAYLDFYATRYPNVTAEFVYTSDWEEPPAPPSGLLLWQCDPRWKDEKVASLGCTSTLCQTGCWISACAMVQRFFGIRSDATPHSANQALGTVGGFSGCLTLWSGMKTALGLEVVKKTFHDTEAQQWLDAGNVCFAEVEPESYLHFVLATHAQDGRFWMYDPYKNVEGWLDEHYSGVESWRLIRPFVPDPPEPPPPPPPPPLTSHNHIGLHLQTMSENWDGYLAEAKPRVTKVLASMHDVLGALRAYQETKVIWRHVDNDYGDVWGPDPRTGAQNWLARFQDSLFEICDRVAQEFPHLPEPYFYAECINEPYNSNAPDVIHAANIDIEYIHAIEALGLPVKAAVFCAAVGNPHHLGGQYESLVPLARVAAQTGSPFGYHNYWLGNAEYGGPEHLGKYLAFRWAEMDKVFRANGVKVYWYGGESGVVGGESGHNPDGTGWVSLNANSGWRGCYGGDWPRYEADFVYVNDWLNQWNASHDDCNWGLTIFTVGSHFTGWREFQLDEAQINRLAVVLG